MHNSGSSRPKFNTHAGADKCKRRKVRCDGQIPCSSCKTAQFTCGYSIIPQKRGRVVRKRPLVGSIGGTPSTTSPAETVITPPTGPQDICSITDLLNGSSPKGTVLSGTVLQDANVHNVQQPSPNSLELIGPELLETHTVYDLSVNAARIQTNLLEHVVGFLPSTTTITDLASQCVDIYMQYLFPHTPLSHEPTLRVGISALETGNPASYVGPQTLLLERRPQLTFMRTFTLITALCALVLSVVPEARVAQKDVLAKAFLQASRAMLLLYEAYDLEHPDSTSLLTRAWHASAMQNTSGKSGAATQCHFNAEILALRLRLFEEESVARDLPVESQLLRSAFWVLYHSDRCSAVFRSRTFILHEKAFDGDFTVLERGDISLATQLDMTRAVNRAPLEDHIMEAFGLKRRLWSTAADLLEAIKRYPHAPSTVGSVAGAECSQTDSRASVDAEVSRLYLSLTGLIGNMPTWLRCPDKHGVGHRSNGTIEAEVAEYQATCLMAVRSHIMTSFYCIQLLVLQRCIVHGTLQVLGFDHYQLACDMRKIQLSEDFLRELRAVPFELFQFQGEPAVSPHSPILFSYKMIRISLCF